MRLYNANKELVGALGVSGDDNVNYRGVVAEPSMQSDFSHPICKIAGVDGVSAISAGLPPTRKQNAARLHVAAAAYHEISSGGTRDMRADFGDKSTVICHITTRTAWNSAQASGQFFSPEFNQHGFIHCSTPEQVLLVANAFFAGQSGRVLLVIDPARLKSPVRWEAAHSTGRLPDFTRNAVFPHVYGPINTDAVVRTVELVPNETGMFFLPQPA